MFQPRALRRAAAALYRSRRDIDHRIMHLPEDSAAQNAAVFFTRSMSVRQRTPMRDHVLRDARKMLTELSDFDAPKFGAVEGFAVFIVVGDPVFG